jgi:Cu(I)/Ag(I) efflux system membrane fusion protein
MRKQYIVNTVVLVCLLMISACNRNKTIQHDAHEDSTNLAHLLQPTNAQVVSTLPVIKADYGTRIVTAEAHGVINYDTRNERSIASRVSGRIERLLIKYNFQPVRKGQLIMEVYAPDLAAAQQELLFLQQSETDLSLLERGKQRLLLLGMTTSAVNHLLKTKRVNYRIPIYSPADGYILEKSTMNSSTNPTVSAPTAAGDGMSSMGGASPTAVAPPPSVPASTEVILREGQYINAGQSLFTIYNASSIIAEFSLKPSLASHIKKGDKFIFYKASDKSTAQNANIGLIQPLIKNGENFTLAQVYLHTSDFRIGELLTAKIPIRLAASWWLPESAVVSLGDQMVLFKKEGNVVVPKAVKTGIRLDKMIQITEDISNWEISKYAAYLIDSESFIKR